MCKAFARQSLTFQVEAHHTRLSGHVFADIQERHCMSYSVVLSYVNQSTYPNHLTCTITRYE